MLSPDDVWLTILLQFSKYVNKHSEELRSKLVSHEGQKELSVTTSNELKESEWEEFFTLTLAAIAENTKGEVVELLQCNNKTCHIQLIYCSSLCITMCAFIYMYVCIANFSTTGIVEKMMSTATIMNSMKKL